MSELTKQELNLLEAGHALGDTKFQRGANQLKKKIFEELENKTELTIGEFKTLVEVCHAKVTG